MKIKQDNSVIPNGGSKVLAKPCQQVGFNGQNFEGNFTHSKLSQSGSETSG